MARSRGVIDLQLQIWVLNGRFWGTQYPTQDAVLELGRRRKQIRVLLHAVLNGYEQERRFTGLEKDPRSITIFLFSALLSLVKVRAPRNWTAKGRQRFLILGEIARIRLKASP